MSHIIGRRARVDCSTPYTLQHRLQTVASTTLWGRAYGLQPNKQCVAHATKGSVPYGTPCGDEVYIPTTRDRGDGPRINRSRN